MTLLTRIYVKGLFISATICMVIHFVSTVKSCPDRCTCTEKEDYVYVGCPRANYGKLPENLPTNVTDVNFSFNKMKAITPTTLENLFSLEVATFRYNFIESIDNDAFKGLLNLKRLDLSRNRLLRFPWNSMLPLTQLEILKLDGNRITNVPQKEASHRQLEGLTLLTIYSNPFNCSCSYWLFAYSLMAKTHKVSLPNLQQIKCETPLRWVTQGFFKRANSTDCVTPKLDLNAQVFKNKTSGKTLLKPKEVKDGIAYFSILRNRSVALNCALAQTSKTKGVDYVLKTSLAINEEDKLNTSGVAWSNTTNVVLSDFRNITSIRFMCLVESIWGTTAKQLLIKVVEKEGCQNSSGIGNCQTTDTSEIQHKLVTESLVQTEDIPEATAVQDQATDYPGDLEAIPGFKMMLAVGCFLFSVPIVPLVVAIVYELCRRSAEREDRFVKL